MLIVRDAFMKTRIRQEIAFAETRVAGTYKYRNLFQLRPINPEAPTLEWVMGHHPFLLEYSYDLPDVSETSYNPSIPDHALLPMIDQEASGKAKKWILLVLSTFAKSRIFQYDGSPHLQQWFMRLPRDTKETEIPPTPCWGQPGYRDQGIYARILEGFSALDEPSIGLVDTNEYYQTETPRQYVVGKTSNTLELPNRIDGFLDKYMALSDPQRTGFLSSCFLFDKGIQLFFEAPSLAFAACVSSLETLVAVDHKGESPDRCECCQQLKHRVRQKFLEFIKKYGGVSREARKLADRVYERRSGILHEGQLFVGEVDQRTIEGAIDWINDDQSRRNVIRFFRTCIINWLITNGTNKEEAL